MRLSNKFKEALLYILLLFVVDKIAAQNDLNSINELPITKEVKAPVFNTVSQYNFSVDTLRKILYIQDIRSSKAGKPHFYQWLYEIPVDNLHFEIERTPENEIQITVHSSNEKRSFIKYWFQNGKISSVQNVNRIVLGDWESSTINLSKIENGVKELNKRFLNIGGAEKILNNSENGTFKYIAENVRTINVKMDENKLIGNYALNSFFNDKDKAKSPTIVQRIDKKITSDIDRKSPIPVIIYTTADGEYEDIQMLTLNSSFPIKINDSGLESINKSHSPVKYVFLF